MTVGLITCGRGAGRDMWENMENNEKQKGKTLPTLYTFALCSTLTSLPARQAPALMSFCSSVRMSLMTLP